MVAVYRRGPADLDEAPQVYRKLDSVLTVQPGIKVLETLTPLIVCMAPSRTVDPFKD